MSARFRLPFRVRRHLTSRRWHPFDDFESRVVWMFGSPRSGSTWLWKMLAEDPRVVGLNEPHIGFYLSGSFLSDLPGFDADQLDLDSFTLRRTQSQNRESMFADVYADVWGPDLNRLITNRLRAHAIRNPAVAPFRQTLVVVKEPNGSQSADIVMQVQPRARLLFLLRDGRDVVDSEVDANEVGSWVSTSFRGFEGISQQERLAFVAQSAHKWLWRTEMVEIAYRQHPGPKLLVRYEDLLREPHQQMRRIVDWLELRYSDAELDEVIERNAFDNIPASERGEHHFFRSATPGLWAKDLSADERAVVVDILGPKLVQLGYEVDLP